MLNRFTFVCLALIAAPSRGAEWKIITISDNRDVYFVDVSSIRTVGTTRLFWLMRVNGPMTERISSTRSKYKIYCDDEKEEMQSMIAYDRKGGVVSSLEVSYPEKSSIAPDTVASTISAYVCGDPAKWLDEDSFPTPEKTAQAYYADHTRVKSQIKRR